MSNKIDLEDVLGEASSFVHAIFMAAAGLCDTRDTSAIQMIAMQIGDRLDRALRLVDDPRGFSGGNELGGLDGSGSHSGVEGDQH